MPALKSIFFEHPFDHPGTGWWFGTWLDFAGLFFHHIGNFIIQTDELSIIFQRGRAKKTPTRIPTSTYRVRFLCKLPAIHVPGVASHHHPRIYEGQKGLHWTSKWIKWSCSVGGVVLDEFSRSRCESSATGRKTWRHTWGSWRMRSPARFFSPRDWSDRPGKSWEIAVGNPGKASLPSGNLM